MTAALSQDAATGAVYLDQSRCVGCWMCLMVCPYDAIVRDVQRQVAIKCDLCPGRETPACVMACPTEALMVREIP